MAKILENTLGEMGGNRQMAVYHPSCANLGSSLGLCARLELFPDLLLTSLLGVVGHHHGKGKSLSEGCGYHAFIGGDQTRECTIKLSISKHRGRL